MKLNTDRYTDRSKITSANHYNKVDVYSQKHLIDNHLLARLDKLQSYFKKYPSILLKRKSP